jgi:hypothetical protein
MHAMEELRKTLEKELEKISAKGTINETDLMHVDKLTHSIKSIDTIMAMQDAGYSETRPYYGSYDSYDDGNSYARGRRRDRMGRYSRDDGYSGGRWGRDGDGDGRYSEGRYSMGGGSIRERLEEMMHDAQNDNEREAIRRAMSQVN